MWDSATCATLDVLLIGAASHSRPESLSSSASATYAACVTPESEKQTRLKRIDKQLDALGWVEAKDGSEPATGPYRKPEVHTKSGPADYGLYVDQKLVGIVEAKKLGLAPQNVLSQAERYSEGAVNASFSFGKFRVPFIYSSNGEIIWFRDVRHDLNRSREISHFHTPAALVEMLERDVDGPGQWLQGNPSDHAMLRSYQHLACHAIEQ